MSDKDTNTRTNTQTAVPGASKTSCSSSEEATPSSPRDAPADHDPSPSRQRGGTYSRASPPRTKRSPFAPLLNIPLPPSSLPLKESRRIISLLLWYSHREEEPQKETRSRTPKMGPTVGRPCDPQWVVITTYCRFFRRPTVGRFLPPLRMPSQETETAPLSTIEYPLLKGEGDTSFRAGKSGEKATRMNVLFRGLRRRIKVGDRGREEEPPAGKQKGGLAPRVLAHLLLSEGNYLTSSKSASVMLSPAD